MLCAASASSMEEFDFNEALGRRAQFEGAAEVFPCFAIHPQLPAYLKNFRRGNERSAEPGTGERLELLVKLAGQGRLAAVGEAGFDLFDAQHRETEKQQDDIFTIHAQTALRYELPLVLHARRAMHKIFAHSAMLKKCRAVVFHSWPGTVDDARALLGRGINAWFSFGTAILLNHRRAMRSCAALPADRLLLETDAPYQPPRNCSRRYSSWEDLPAILNTAAALRREAGAQDFSAGGLEIIIENNFRAVFGNYSVHKLVTT